MTHDLTFPLPLTRGQPFTFRELADVYMSCYQGRDKWIGTRLGFFVEQFGDKIAHDIDGDDVHDAIQTLIRRGRVINHGGRYASAVRLVSTGKPLAPATVNRHRTVLQGILTWAQKRRLMPKGWVNPVRETEVLPVGGGRLRYLSPDEYERLLKAARVSNWKKLHVLIKMAVTTGARKGALLGLRWRDIDLANKRAFVERTKNDEPFVMVLQEDVAWELRKIKGQSRPDDIVFCGKDPSKPMDVRYPLITALADARIEGVVFHTFRHTHASWLAQKGVPLLTIAESMNHKTLAMTKRYAHLCVDSRAQTLEKVFGTTAA